MKSKISFRPMLTTLASSLAVLACLVTSLSANADTATKHIRDPEPPVYKTITIKGEFVCEIGNTKTDCTAEEYAEFYQQHPDAAPDKFKKEPAPSQ